MNYTHSENLNKFIQEVIKESKHQLIDLHAIAVSIGPGSYTGLRIGVSSAKGLAYALNIPVIAISTLQSLAFSFMKEMEPDDLIIPMIDARRMEVYCAVYDNKLHEKEEVKALVLDQNSFMYFKDAGKIWLVGDGVEKIKAIHNASQFNYIHCFPTSKSMVQLAHQKYLSSDFVDIAYFEPFYLKDFIAG